MPFGFPLFFLAKNVYVYKSFRLQGRQKSNGKVQRKPENWICLDDREVCNKKNAGKKGYTNNKQADSHVQVQSSCL